MAFQTMNRHAVMLDELLPPSGVSPFEIIVRLAALSDRGNEGADIVFAETEKWTPENRNLSVVNFFGTCSTCQTNQTSSKRSLAKCLS